jgi:hypothetical protein
MNLPPRLSASRPGSAWGVASWIVAALACGGCSAPVERQSEPPPPRDQRSTFTSGPSEPFRFQRPSVEVQYLPAVWITPDVDDDKFTGKEPDLSTGQGVFARAGLGSNQQNIGLSYFGSWFDENESDHDARIDAVQLDFQFRAPLPEGGGIGWFSVAAGLGAAELSFSGSAFDDETTGIASLRGELEFRVVDPLTLSAGFGGLILGVPGDTVAYGTFLMVGAKLIF